MHSPPYRRPPPSRFSAPASASRCLSPSASPPAAVKILRICQRFSLPVPERIAVLGVDNDEVLCASTKTELSSVMPDHGQVGFAAAKELDRLMRGGEGREVVFPESVKGVALRTSTRIVPPAARVISDALAFIKRNASGKLRVSDVARHIGVSRRLADLRFQHVHDCTIHDAIAKALFEKATARLAAGDSPGKVARELLFSSSAAFTRFFRSMADTTPSAWIGRN